MSLMNNSELIGWLGAVTNENGMLHLKFTIETELEIPEKAISLSELQQNTGKLVGIFNLDGKYKLRQVIKCRR